jgi:hypothetical protein
VTTKHEKELSIQAITICDPATGWFEVAEIWEKHPKVLQNYLIKYGFVVTHAQRGAFATMEMNPG